MSIYTKTGDKGQTSLANGERVDKTDARIEAYGTADELNSWVGLLASKSQDEIIGARLERIQNGLFNLGALLSSAPGDWITAADVQEIEVWLDELQTELPPLRAFVLPGGSEGVSLCHLCRTVTRRLERRMWAVDVPSEAMQYVNRLSDFFFLLSRKWAKNEGISLFLWKK